MEITSCEETSFKCVHPCAVAVEIKSSETLEAKEGKKYSLKQKLTFIPFPFCLCLIGWILVVKADRLTPEFVRENTRPEQMNGFDM